MPKALIIYGSATGNTQYIAEKLLETLKNEGLDVILHDAADIKDDDPLLSNIAKDYDLVLLGCSTWGVDEVVLQEDFEVVFEKMEKLGLKDRNVASFAAGDSSFPVFCGSTDEIRKKAEDLGAKIIASDLKIDNVPEDSEEDIISWGKDIAQKIK